MQSSIEAVPTVEQVERRIRLITQQIDPDRMKSGEHDLFRDVLYTIGNDLTEDPKGIAKAAFESWRVIP